MRTERIAEICSHLTKTEVFADIGCDHGFCAQYMLERALCERAYITDISADSLRKAERLLAPYLAAGKCVSVCCDGLEGLAELPTLALIAGMGGEEIVKILSRALPQKLVLQPMKNAPKVRAFLVEHGYKILRDYTFGKDKFYDIIVCKRGEDGYSPWETEFGRDNLKSPSDAFLKRIRKEQAELRQVLMRDLSYESREDVRQRLYRLEEITDAVDGDI